MDSAGESGAFLSWCDEEVCAVGKDRSTNSGNELTFAAEHGMIIKIALGTSMTCIEPIRSHFLLRNLNRGYRPTDRSVVVSIHQELTRRQYPSESNAESADSCSQQSLFARAQTDRRILKCKSADIDSFIQKMASSRRLCFKLE